MNGSRCKCGVKARRPHLNIDLDFLRRAIPISLELDEILLQLDNFGERTEGFVKEKIAEIKDAKSSRKKKG